MRKWLILPILLAAAVPAGWMIHGKAGNASAVAQEPHTPAAVPVTAEKATTRDMPVYVRGIGNVQAYNTVTIKSRVDGQIVKVDFTEGQEVKAGDLLFEIDPRPYQAALALATANKAKDEASLASQQADLVRDEKLLEHDFQTRQAYDQQKALVGSTQAAIAGDAAQIETAQLNLQYAQIRSPIDGRTGARLVDVGNLVHATDNTGLVTITQLRPIFVSFTEPQGDFETVRASQQRGPVPVQAIAASGTKKLADGTLSLIDNQIDQASGTIHLKAVFQNAQETLWPGEFVNLQLVVDTLKNAVTVPDRAIQQGPDGPYLFVVNGDMTVETRDVGVAETEDGFAVISKGLDAGETVVVDGQYRLDKGTKVSFQSSSALGG
ncbi:MAG TPA: efflux RND transporter periplasmic adaptor subunit, partial [Stellaceae bacterium]|nr:efflux RND transporter periplasmic adaptor subunit [Stellaceae bacterium]